MKKINLIYLSLTATRTGACGYCSAHFGEIKFPAVVDSPLFYGFIAYQFLKLSFYYTSSSFNDKAHSYLVKMYWVFLAIVIWTCVNHLIADTYNITDKRILSEKGLICFCQIAIYLIFEWVAEFLYCLKRPEYSEWIKQEGNNYLQLFWKGIKSYFGHKIDLSQMFKPNFYEQDNDEISVNDPNLFPNENKNTVTDEEKQDNSKNGKKNHNKKIVTEKVLKEVIEKHRSKK